MWFYEFKDTTVGPVSEQVIQQLVLAGVIDGETLVCRDDSSDWLPLTDTPLLRSREAQQPPKPSRPRSGKSTQSTVAAASPGQQTPTKFPHGLPTPLVVKATSDETRLAPLPLRKTRGPLLAGLTAAVGLGLVAALLWPRSANVPATPRRQLDPSGGRLIIVVDDATAPDNTAKTAGEMKTMQILPRTLPENAASPKSGEGWTLADLKLEMKFIRPGTFAMGSTADEIGHLSDETQHQVTLTRGFWMGATEVTQAQWTAVIGSYSPYFHGDTLPMETVAWDDAMAFCQKLTAQEKAAGRLPPGYIYTLPTEAQWEYACRAGTTGPYAGDLDAMAWYKANSDDVTHPVGTKQPNAWGLFDMNGNVSEWCYDWSGLYPDGAVADPTGPATGSFRVVRGASWDDSALNCRSAVRFRRVPSYQNYDEGFRLALSAVHENP
jgi:formylglycine-generating enzyme required for sulfatase activity